HLYFFFWYVFFFQAEDGIRDATVTGVQTCALPIFAQIETEASAAPLGVAPGAGALAVAEASVSIWATTVLTGTVSPSFTLTSANVPAAGAGISASTLSVEISKIGSSRATLSPGFLSQRVRVPSAMLSPIWGMMTSTRSVCSFSRRLSIATRAQPRDVQRRLHPGAVEAAVI